MVNVALQRIVLVDNATAMTLSQVLPVLLLTLTVELRRTQIHQRFTRIQLGASFAAFGLVETLLVMSIDGAIYPFQWFDVISALIIFSLLGILFVVSLVDPPSRPPGDDGPAR